MVEIIFENEAWLPFFTDALEEIGISHRLNFIETQELNLSQPPDNVVFLNRVSPSAHRRGHNRSIIRSEQYLEYLAAYNRVVVNDRRTIDYEYSKVAQYQLLKRHGLAYPHTVFGSELNEIIDATRNLRFPVVTRHNCGGMGIGMHRFETNAELTEYLHSEKFEPSPDGILLVQEYVEPRHNRITRVEIIDGALVYALHGNVAGGFNMCPADGGYAVAEGFEHPLVEKYCDMAKSAGFDMAGIEFIESVNGMTYTLDINGTTTYSSDVEKSTDYAAKKAFQRMITTRAS